MSAAYICDGVRTPIGRSGGALGQVRADELATLPLKALMARHPDLNCSAVGEAVLGCAKQAGEHNRNLARMALLPAGLPDSVPSVTVNRLCASGLEAVGYATPETTENVADAFQVSWADQDAFALRSQQRSRAAIDAGFFPGEIVPAEVPGKAGLTIVDQDEHPRDTTLEALGKLKPVVRQGAALMLEPV